MSRGFHAAARLGRHDVGLDGRSGFAREHEQRRVRVGERVPNLVGIDRVEHPEFRKSWRDADDLPKYFGREARSAHSEQYNVGYTVRFGTLREGKQARHEWLD